MSDSVELRALVRLQRGQSYHSALLDAPGPFLIGLGTIRRNGGFKDTDLRTYGGDSPVRTLIGAGDLFVSLKDMTHAADLLGAVARVPNSITQGRLSQDTIRIDVVSPSVDREYLFWALRTPNYRSYCRSRGTGTTNLDLSQDDFLAFKILLPSMSAQRQIAEVLGALDDKIAANTRLATTAHQLADATFDSVAAGAVLSDRTYADVSRIYGGGTPSTKESEYWDGGIGWATPTDITALEVPYLEGTKRTITAAGLAACSSDLHEPGAILMTSRATIGAFAVNQVPTAVNQGFIVVRTAGDIPQWWLYHEMRSRVDEFKSLANGATFLELSRGRFKNIPVLLANRTAMWNFDSEVGLLHDCARAHAVESDKLGQLRDTLLPELMSGRMRVKDAEQQVEGVV